MLFNTSYYRHLSANSKIKIIRLIPVLLASKGRLSRPKNMIFYHYFKEIVFLFLIQYGWAPVQIQLILICFKDKMENTLKLNRRNSLPIAFKWTVFIQRVACPARNRDVIICYPSRSTILKFICLLFSALQLIKIVYVVLSLKVTVEQWNPLTLI